MSEVAAIPAQTRFLFVIWSKARQFEERILGEISSRFRVVRTFEVAWPRRHFTANLAAFYGWKGRFCWWNKARKCGRGPFLAIEVEDPSPKWERGSDTSGHDLLLNRNIQDAKQVFRAMTGHSNRIHASMTCEETAHELAALDSVGPDGLIPYRDMQYGGVQSQRFELSLKGNGGKYAYELVVDNGGKQGMCRISTERLLYDNKPIFAYGDSNVHLFDNDTYVEKVTFGSDWSKSFISSVVDRHENSKLIWFRNWMDKSVVLNPNPWHIQSAASSESRLLDRTMSNFAQWFRYLKQVSPDGKYSELLQDLKFALHGFQGLRFVDIGDSAKELKIQMLEGEYSLRELSEGQRLIMALYTAFHFATSEDGVFCIDEPDNFLGLGEIEPLVSTLLDDDSDGQRIVSSHHPEFYNRVQYGHGLYFCRNQEIDDSATRVRSFESVFGGHNGIDVSEVVARGWED